MNEFSDRIPEWHAKWIRPLAIHLHISSRHHQSFRTGHEVCGGEVIGGECEMRAKDGQVCSHNWPESGFTSTRSDL